MKAVKSFETSGNTQPGHTLYPRRKERSPQYFVLLYLTILSLKRKYFEMRHTLLEFET
jgi:hypothetical protein